MLADPAQLIACFRGPLVGYLASRGASPRDASELAQDAIAEAYLGRERFAGAADDAGAIGPWLRGIAHNLLRAHRRRAGREGGDLERVRESLATEVAPGEPESALAVRRALATLRASWRDVLAMHYLEGSSLADIAALLGTTARSIEGRLYRARSALRVRLEQDDAGPTETRKEAR